MGRRARTGRNPGQRRVREVVTAMVAREGGAVPDEVYPVGWLERIEELRAGTTVPMSESVTRTGRSVIGRRAA